HCPQKVRHYLGAFFMVKYRKHKSDFKLKIVNAHIGGESINGLSNKWGISTSQIRKWIDQHSASGTLGLLRRSSQQYTKGFKLMVVQAYLNKELSLRDCCLRFHIPSIGIISSWVNIYERLGKDGLNNRQKGRKPMKEKKSPKIPAKKLTRLEELEKENLYLRAENELLKKLEALAQKQETLQKKKR
ncbi:helix-turn-helix domain-containing protein, partial [Paraflavitalea pollutisoli]|uniref:helix-turn-helix domain-containing protein n=1 Tax=Paraflavitalea pollutisoli TaxID=3034143 RepID=UPI0023EB987E